MLAALEKGKEMKLILEFDGFRYEFDSVEDLHDCTIEMRERVDSFETVEEQIADTMRSYCSGCLAVSKPAKAKKGKSK